MWCCSRFFFFLFHLQHPILISSSCDFKSELFLSFLLLTAPVCCLSAFFFSFTFSPFVGSCVCRYYCCYWFIDCVNWNWLVDWLVYRPRFCRPEYKCTEFNFNWFLQFFLSFLFFLFFWGKMMSIVCVFFSFIGDVYIAWKRGHIMPSFTFLFLFFAFKS